MNKLNAIIENNLDVTVIETILANKYHNDSIGNNLEFFAMKNNGIIIGWLSVQLNTYTGEYEIVFFNIEDKIQFVLHCRYFDYKKWVASIYNASYNDILDNLSSVHALYYDRENKNFLSYKMYQLVLDLQLFKRPTKLTDNRL